MVSGFLALPSLSASSEEDGYEKKVAVDCANDDRWGVCVASWNSLSSVILPWQGTASG